MTHPWESELDRYEFEHAGLKCLILRNPGMKNLCGYVGLPPAHPSYGKGYDDIEAEVHGGLTFGGGGDGERYPSGYWWVGFDCGHSGDLSPGYPAFLLLRHSGDVYRDVNYVRHEVCRLAEQLAQPGG